LTIGKTSMAAGPPNPKGFYENQALTDFHDKFLRSVGTSWQDPKPISKDRFQGSAPERFREELFQLLKHEFRDGRPLIKDPRMCRLMPLWIPLIQEHFPKAGFILSARHPVEVAHSLHQLYDLTVGMGLELWASHVLESERTTRVFPRLLVTHGQLMGCDAKIILRLARTLDLPTESVASTVSARIDPTLRHHKASSWPTGEPHKEWTLSIYQTLVGQEPDSEKSLDRLREEYYGNMGWGC
jgi:hypothetical protein